MSGDTTEAMRAAFEVWSLKQDGIGPDALTRYETGGYQWHDIGLRWAGFAAGWECRLPENEVSLPRNADEAALMALLGAAYLDKHAPERLKSLAGRAPAAPAVTDSTHTGAVPHCPNCNTHEVELKRVCHNSKCADYAKELTVHEGWKGQPSPERNDCAPVEDGSARWWVTVALAELDGVETSDANNCLTAARGALQDALRALTAPPPPAERNDCERCGKRLGSTRGVHACTPPGDVS